MSPIPYISYATQLIWQKTSGGGKPRPVSQNSPGRGRLKISVPSSTSHAASSRVAGLNPGYPVGTENWSRSPLVPAHEFPSAGKFPSTHGTPVLFLVAGAVSMLLLSPASPIQHHHAGEQCLPPWSVDLVDYQCPARWRNPTPPPQQGNTITTFVGL